MKKIITLGVTVALLHSVLGYLQHQRPEESILVEQRPQAYEASRLTDGVRAHRKDNYQNYLNLKADAPTQNPLQEGPDASAGPAPPVSKEQNRPQQTYPKPPKENSSPQSAHGQSQDNPSRVKENEKPSVQEDDRDDVSTLAPNDPFLRWSLGARSGSQQWAIVYFPYYDDSSCKSKASIREDISNIARKGFTSVRLHAMDCHALENVGSAVAENGMRLILGVHVDEDGLDAAQPQIDEIARWGRRRHPQQQKSEAERLNYELVELLVVGEETIFNDFLPSPLSLASFLNSTRSRLRSTGYQGPVTTTEPIPTLYEYAHILCPAIDVPAANVHPFFHSDVSADEAGEYVRDALGVLEGDVCRGYFRHELARLRAKKIRKGTKPSSHDSESDSVVRAVNLETGWPSRGNANGRAVPGTWQQSIAIEGIMKAAGRSSVLLGFGDDKWKDEGELGVEGAWGCDDLFATAKTGERRSRR